MPPAHTYSQSLNTSNLEESVCGLCFQNIIYHWGKLEQELKAYMGFFLDRKGGQVRWAIDMNHCSIPLWDAGNAQPRWYLEFIFDQRSSGRMLFSVPYADIGLPLCFHKQWQGKTGKFVPVMGEATHQPTFSQKKFIPNVCLALWENSHLKKRKGIIWKATVIPSFLSSFLFIHCTISVVLFSTPHIAPGCWARHLQLVLSSGLRAVSYLLVVRMHS